MNVFKAFRQEIEKIAERMSARGELPPDLPMDRISVEPPRDPAHGDVSSNAAMVLAGAAKRKPRDLAEDIAAALRETPDVEAAEVAGPGFVNLRLGTGFWQARVADVLEAGRSYGDSDVGGGRPVNVEYVSANPTGPMHVGHARGAVIGDVLATLLAKAGYRVTREYYVNDAGAQIEALARSALLRYREALGESVGEIPPGLYPGEYLVPIGKALADRDSDRWTKAPEDEALAAAGDFAVAAMMAAIREDLSALGIEHDVFRSERDLRDSVSAVVGELRQRDLVYVGALDPPKGRKPDDWEEREQLLFRSTEFGDDIDRPLTKSGGDWTYFAADMAYHLDKFKRGFDLMVDVWGADHKGYIGRMRAAVAAVTDGEARLDVRICNLVNLFEKGRPVKMSKRSGTFVTLREVVDEVGRDVVRFMMLTRGNDAPLDFDLERSLDQSRDNPVFYVQYAHARACSVLRNVRDVFPRLAIEDSALAAADMSAVDDEAELALIRSLAGWPRLVEAAAAAREPHRIAYYLHHVAAAFHGLWNKGNETAGLRFIVPADEDLTCARLALVRATALVVASGLQIMGVEPVEEMR